MPCEELDRGSPDDRAWVAEAIRKVDADANRSADTHLHVFPLPRQWGIDLYLKDESVHPTGSLKHRLARSLFLYALANGWICEGTTVVEASSGSTAVSRGLLREAARVAVRRGDAAIDQRGEDLPDRVAGGPMPPGRQRCRNRGRSQACRGRVWLPLHGPVHLRRTSHRLAR